jgi:hypothetical protein
MAVAEEARNLVMDTAKFSPTRLFLSLAQASLFWASGLFDHAPSKYAKHIKAAITRKTDLKVLRCSGELPALKRSSSDGDMIDARGAERDAAAREAVMLTKQISDKAAATSAASAC